MSITIIRLISEVKKDPLKRSVILNTLCKPASMFISFVYTPMLLHYLGDESYGIWSTMLSVINWINYFDVGIGNGLRNMLVKDINENNLDEANHAVSTGYVVLSLISSIIFLIGGALILFANVNSAFNTDINIRPALFASFAFICINFILALSKVQLYATHQAEKVGLMTLATQLLNLLGIIVISLFHHESILLVSLVIGASGIIVNILFTGNIWKHYRYLIPHFSAFQKEKLKDICNVGLKFFALQMAALVLYSTDNMIITQLLGPASVTAYYTSYTAFGIVNGLFSAMLAPLWSKYTAASVKNDYLWMKKTILKLDKMLPIIVAMLLVGVLVYKPVSVIWLRKELIYEKGLIPCMGLYYFLMIWGSIYSTALNGMGRVNLQLILGVTTAILNIPLSIFLGGTLGLGTTGVLLATVSCMLISNIIVTVDTHRYFNKFLQ